MPREGHKFSSWSIRSLSTHFNPHAPGGARLPTLVYLTSRPSYFNPRAQRGARPSNRRFTAIGIINFNPRAPRGARLCRQRRAVQPGEFQSTCPSRGTTLMCFATPPRLENFNPRAPRGARHLAACNIDILLVISIHVPLAGHDAAFVFDFPFFLYFNPRAPRGARQSQKPTTVIRRQFQSTCPARGTWIEIVSG